jgi:hypothetical protein
MENKENARSISVPESTESHRARRMSMPENVMLTAKVLGTIGLIGAALWGADVLMSAR